MVRFNQGGLRIDTSLVIKTISQNYCLFLRQIFVNYRVYRVLVSNNPNLSLQLAAQRPENSGGAAFIPPRIFPDPAELNQQSGLLKAAELEQQSGFLNGHTSRVPTAVEEQEDSSQASLELIQQTRKPEFSAPGTVQKKNTHSVVFY